MRTVELFVVAIISVCIALLISSCDAQQPAVAQNVTIWNSKMWVGNQEFFVRGVDYNPSPLGYSPAYSANSTGFCSYRLAFANSYMTNCYDSDYWDSTPWPQNKSVNGFQPLWLRDFPIMKMYNVTAIRMYSANPTTQAAVDAYSHLVGFQNTLTRQHTLFLDTAQQFNIKVGFPLYFVDQAFNLTTGIPIPQYQRYLRWIIDELGNHPALLWWHFGNEQAWTWLSQGQYIPDSAMVSKYNDFVDYIKRYTFSKWNRWLPVSYSLQNNQKEEAWLIQNLHYDFASLNFFTTANSDFTGMMSVGMASNGATFTPFANSTCRFMKPLLLTELGPNSNSATSQNYQQGQDNLLWYNVLNYYESGLLGGLIFEQTDEAQQIGFHSGKVGKFFGVVSVSVWGNSTWNSVTANCFTPDIVTPKTLYYDLISGTTNQNGVNVSANFLTDITTWPAVNRPLWTSYAKSVDRCPQYPMCPGTKAGSPPCSGNGMCDRLTGNCSCGTGWTGLACDQPVCNCNGRGICSTVISPPECLCTYPWYGPNCASQVVPGQCPGLGNAATTYPYCTYGNGWCNSTSQFKCVCVAGWVGADCAVTDVNSNYLLSTSSTFGFTTSSTLTLASTSSTSTQGTTSSSASTTKSASTTSLSASTTTIFTASTASSTSSTISAATTSSATTSIAQATSSSTTATMASTTGKGRSTSTLTATSTSTGGSVAPTTTVPTTVAPTTVAPTTVAPTTVAPTTVAPTTVAPTTVAPTIVVPTTVAPTTVAPTTAAPTGTVPRTVRPTNVPTTTVSPTTPAVTTNAVPTTVPTTTTVPSTAVPTTVPATSVLPTTVPPTITVAPTTAVPTTVVPSTVAPTTPSVSTQPAPTTKLTTTGSVNGATSSSLVNLENIVLVIVFLVIFA